ncbi:hypothetical protein MTO96_003289 [Rhipicephalus appendiculatus]
MAAASDSDGGAGLRVVGNGQDKQRLQTRGSAGYLLEDPDADDIIHKTILVGDSGVGKTSLLVQFDQGKFPDGLVLRHSRHRLHVQCCVDANLFATAAKI